MPAFAYIGDHEGTEVFGLRFPRGTAVEVSDPHAVMKLRNNSHFSEVFDGVEVLEPAPEKKRGRPRKGA